jgi:hypothetical protein
VKQTFLTKNWGGDEMLHIAKDFVKMKFEKTDGVIGVLLTGSASIGYTDALSDIDLEIISTEDLYRKAGETCGSEQSNGVDVWWEWITLEELENALKDWKDDVDLWVYSRSKILYDPKHKIKNLLAKYRQYPRKVWPEKLFLYWYFATANAPYDSGKAIQRNDLPLAQLYLTQATEYYTALIFILNHSFVPYRKWRLRELGKLTYKPENYEESMLKILTVRGWTEKEFEDKQRIVNELAIVLEKKLVEAGISEEKVKNPWKFKVTYVPRT